MEKFVFCALINALEKAIMTFFVEWKSDIRIFGCNIFGYTGTGDK